MIVHLFGKEDEWSALVIPTPRCSQSLSQGHSTTIGCGRLTTVNVVELPETEDFHAAARAASAFAHFASDVMRTMGEVVPREGQDHPAGELQVGNLGGVRLTPVRCGVEGPPIDLDGNHGTDKRNVYLHYSAG